MSSFLPAPSGPPLNVRAISISDSVIKIIWEPPSFLDRNGVIISYSINLVKVKDGSRKQYKVSGSSSLLQIEGKFTCMIFKTL